MRDRILKVNELIKHELGQILLREVEMPKGAVVTLTRVAASGNLQEAKVYISVMPDEKGQEALKSLSQNVYDIQQVLNERLNMRPVPRIQWVLEKAGAETQHVEELLDKIKKGE